MRKLTIFSLKENKVLDFEKMDCWDEGFLDAESLNADFAEHLARPLLVLSRKYPLSSKIFAALDLAITPNLPLSRQHQLYSLVNEIQIQLLRERK
ncbi:MAG: hypothetical protein ACR2PH_07540 [Desulfobulbia bacterium]